MTSPVINKLKNIPSSKAVIDYVCKNTIITKICLFYCLQLGVFYLKSLKNLSIIILIKNKDIIKNIPKKTVCSVAMDKISTLNTLVSKIPNSKSNKNTESSTDASTKKVFVVL